MGKRYPNPHLVKIYRTYSVDEIVELFKIHPNTVRAWTKSGLLPIDDKQPVLFLGSSLAAFLEARRANSKHPLQAGQIFCLPCHEAKEPALRMVEYIPRTSTSGNLRGLCADCWRLIHRAVNRAELSKILGNLKVTFADAQPTLKDSAIRSVNSGFKRKGKA